MKKSNALSGMKKCYLRRLCLGRLCLGRLRLPRPLRQGARPPGPRNCLGLTPIEGVWGKSFPPAAGGIFSLPAALAGWCRALPRLFVLGCVVLLCACTVEHNDPEREDLFQAELALKERDLGDAEMFLERYLRKNADGARRWEVWNKLLEISLNIRQDASTAMEYLEIMLDEFAADPPKRRSIQMQLAGLAKGAQAHSRAVTLWEALAADPDTPAEDRAIVYKELSGAYLRRLEFTEATDVLGLCLDLDIAPETKAGCLYALAETRMLTGELPESEKALRDLLALEGMAETRRISAIFMLADVEEQQDRLDEALELLESIRDSYPNTSVVQLRLQTLKEKKKARKSAEPRYKP